MTVFECSPCKTRIFELGVASKTGQLFERKTSHFHSVITHHISAAQHQVDLARLDVESLERRFEARLTVSPSDLAAAIEALPERILAKLRGPKGRDGLHGGTGNTGDRGPIGPQGPPGVVSVSQYVFGDDAALAPETPTLISTLTNPGATTWYLNQVIVSGDIATVWSVFIDSVLVAELRTTAAFLSDVITFARLELPAGSIIDISAFNCEPVETGDVAATLLYSTT